MKTPALLLLLTVLASSLFAQDYKQTIVEYRKQYIQGFLEDERSPIKNADDLQYFRFFDADENYRVVAHFTKTEHAEPLELPTMNGKTKRYTEYGTLTFSLFGREMSLRVYQNLALLEKPEYKDHLFLPFTDSTNGEETYGGGRYLDFETGDIADDKLVIDFNKAYNPYCAIATGYSCPKPPEENNLPAGIRAGEKAFGKSPH
jgi:uncharacterized protein (DUF1684 family)